MPISQEIDPLCWISLQFGLSSPSAGMKSPSSKSSVLVGFDLVAGLNLPIGKSLQQSDSQCGGESLLIQIEEPLLASTW